MNIVVTMRELSIDGLMYVCTDNCFKLIQEKVNADGRKYPIQRIFTPQKTM